VEGDEDAVVDVGLDEVGRGGLAAGDDDPVGDGGSGSPTTVEATTQTMPEIC
jgi:hypothetical protein